MFQDKLRQALKRGRSNSRTNSLFIMEATHELERTEMFHNIRFKKTGEPECTVRITCEPVTSAVEPEDVAKTLVAMLREDLFTCGSEYNAIDIECTADRVQVRFVGLLNQAVVTGTIDVTGLKG